MEEKSAVIVAQTAPSFVRSKGELTKVQKRLALCSEDMIDFMLEQVSDKTVDLKLRLQYAEKLLGYHVEVSKLVNQDNLSRMVAEIKLNNKSTLGGTTVADATPRVDFNTIIEV